MAAATPDPEGRGRRRRLAIASLLVIGVLSQALILSQQLASDPFAAVPINDALSYWQWAGDVASGRLVGSTPFLSAPLYPYLVGAVRALGGGLAAVVVLQAALHLATVALLFRVGERRFGFGAGVAGAGLYLALLEPAYATGRILNSTLQLLVVVWLWDRLIAAAEEPRRGRLAALGAALGVNVLANPAMLAAVPIAAVWIAWRAGWRPGALVAGVAAAAIAPATLHNWLACRELILVSAQGGVTFYHGNAPGAEGVYHPIPGIAGNRIQQNVDARALVAIETDGTWSATSRAFLEKGLAFWSSDPAGALRLLDRKLWYFVTGRNYGDIYVPAFERSDGFASLLALAPVPTAWLTLPALLALGWLLRDRRGSFPEALLLLAPLATVAVFWYSPRYRMPALPVIAMLAAHAFLRSPRERAGAAVVLLVSIATGAWNRHTGFDALSSYRGQYELTVGGVLLEQDRLPEAEARFRAALGAGNASALPALADVLRREGRRDEAIELLRSAVAREPGSAYAHRSLAVALAEAGELPEAEQEFRSAIAIDPNDWEALSGLGNVLHGGGHDDEAIAAHRAAIAKNPAFAAGHYNLGCVLFALRRFAEAEAEFREARRLDPRLVQAQTYLDKIRNGPP